MILKLALAHKHWDLTGMRRSIMLASALRFTNRLVDRLIMAEFRTEAIWDNNRMPQRHRLSWTYVMQRLAALRRITIVWYLQAAHGRLSEAEMSASADCFSKIFKPVLSLNNLGQLDVVHCRRRRPAKQPVEEVREYDQDIDFVRMLGTTFDRASQSPDTLAGSDRFSLNLLIDWRLVHRGTSGLWGFDDLFLAPFVFQAERLAVVPLRGSEHYAYDDIWPGSAPWNAFMLFRMAFHAKELMLRSTTCPDERDPFHLHAPVWQNLRRLCLYNTGIQYGQIIAAIGPNVTDLTFSGLRLDYERVDNRSRLFASLRSSGTAARLERLQILNSTTVSDKILLPKPGEDFWPACTQLRQVALEFRSCPGRRNESDSDFEEYERELPNMLSEVKHFCEAVPETVVEAKVTVLEFQAADHEAWRRALVARVPAAELVTTRRIVQF